MPTHRRPAPGGHRRLARLRSHRLLPIALGLALLGVGGALGPSVVDTVAGGSPGRPVIQLASVPKDTPEQGLVYDGLIAAKAGALCAGSYEVDDITCTHGPDMAPVGLSVRHDVAPVTAKAPEPVPPVRESSVPSDAEIARDEGGSALTADAPALIPDAAPGQADFLMGPHDVACEGDGRNGKRVQVLYLHDADTKSRYTDFVGSIRNWSAGVDQIFDQSAGETGGSRHIRFVTTPQCNVDVSEVQLPVGSLKSFTGSIKALTKLGYNRTDRKYLMFADTNVYCGIATYVADNRKGLGNRNNGGPSYGRVDAGCWSTVMAAHELTDSLGATLTGSPNATGAGGCLDEYDLLCGADRAGRPVREACPPKHENRLDCGHDDYFSTNPKPGSYLDRNWNIADSEFLLRSDGGDDIPDVPGAPAPSAEPPATHSATPTPSRSATPTPTGPVPTGGIENGGGDAPPSAGVTPTTPPPTTATPTPTPDDTPPPTQTLAAKATKPPAEEQTAAAVQAVLEVRDATSSSVRLTWSAASDTATYQVSVDGAPIATTKATRARLIGLKPDATYQVTVKSGPAYTAKSAAVTAPAARPAQNSWFTLTNGLTGGAADLYAARSADGTPITLGETDDDAQQQWQLVPASGGQYTLVSRATGKCVVPRNGAKVAGQPLVQGSCAPSAGGLWTLQASDFGFTLRLGDLVAGVGDQRFGAHRVLALQNGNGQRHQSWTAVPD
ncbi:RICIN domain-containing protein [Actinoplanes sp. TBRC 11911]|uniref:RICIN domain-containing protein n=1 Tax=Actinoplanes sp. TBRC 11911 TaxID=2729386 RepID=UPI002899AE8A|nr:RICIN domain-containing protein [Actinoplanes sp. TBRC 11911]